MNSRISIDVDHDNQPVIKIEYKDSDDVRDKLVKKFLETFGSASRWVSANWWPSTPINTTVVMRPVPPNEILIESEFMKAMHTSMNIDPNLSQELKPGERILDAPVKYTLIEIFKELKFGRPVASQKYLDKCIKELEAQEKIK